MRLPIVCRTILLVRNKRYGGFEHFPIGNMNFSDSGTIIDHPFDIRRVRLGVLGRGIGRFRGETFISEGGDGFLDCAIMINMIFEYKRMKR